MRLLLAIALILLFLWIHKGQISTDALHGNPCEAVYISEAVVSLLLFPLSLHTWLTSMLLRLVLSAPALILSSLHHTLLLLLAGPWCIATVCASLLLTCLCVALYLVHLGLVVGVVAILVLTQPKMGDTETAREKALYQQKNRSKKTRLGKFRCTVAHQE